MGCRLGLGAFGIKARRGRHVEAFGGSDFLRVVHQHERRCPVAGSLDARRSVRLVAENEVERRRAVVLCAFHETERVVGAEDHRHRIPRVFPQRPGNCRRVGGDRDFKLLKRGVFVGTPGAGVGADADIAVRHRPLLRPFAHRLLEQRDRRHQIEYPAADAGDGFRDAQRCKGLARPARHDQLAATMLLKTVRHVVER